MIDDYIKRWLIKAMEDFNVARHELNLSDDEIATGAVCFHCQQFVEKLLKMYLIYKKIDFGKTHDLKFLADLCSQQDSVVYVIHRTGTLNVNISSSDHI